MFKSTMDVHEEVIEELAFDPSVDESKIAVAVSGGVVTLTGSVDSYAQKLAAENAVKRVRGVHGIVEDLKVDVSTLHKRTDADLAKSAVDALRWNPTIPIDAVTVTIQTEWATLSGTVDWQFQREAARLAVASVGGLSGVSNEIVLRERVVVGDIKQKIRNSFKRSSEIDADKIKVESFNDTVTLSGPVHSWNEREDAASAAYSVAGVRHVNNLTTVS